MATHTSFKGVSHIGRDLVSDQLSANMKEYFDWGMLGVGAFSNIVIPTTGAYGGHDHRLRPVSDDNYEDGQIWQSHRQDWVWQTGIEYSIQPIRVSGVYVNNTFYPTSTTGAYKHVVDYPHGRVIFDSPISTTATVQAEYSYRMFSFFTDDEPWCKEVLFKSRRSDDFQFAQMGSGAWDIPAQSRIQLPAVIIEVTPERQFLPLQIGGGQRCRQVIDFHILAENSWDQRKLLDVITLQNNKTIQGFDKNYITDNNMYPLDANGSPVSGAKMYPTLVSETGSGGAFWRKIWFVDMRASEGINAPPFKTAIIRGIFEVDLPEI